MRRPRWRDLAAPRRVDLLIAVGLLTWGLPDVPWWWEYPGHAGSTPDILGSLALTLALSVPFCWRRRFPEAAACSAVAVLAIRMGLHRDVISAFAAVLVGAYGLGAYRNATRRYARWLGWLALAVAVAVVTTHNGDRLAAVPFALLGAALVLGDAASGRRSETAATVEAAHQAERTRIARELHDVVAHQLSAIAVQAGAARMSGTDAPAEVLASVERLSREALTELNHLLGALRREPGDGATRLPAPTLGELNALLATAAASGVPANVSIRGQQRPFPPGIELSAYRILQEALANVARHAPAAPTRVVLRYSAAGLEIEVTNDPSPLAAHSAVAPQPRSGGRGVRGMRERAELYGGCLQAGPRNEGGFAVIATLPCDDVTAARPASAQAPGTQVAAGRTSGER